MTKEKLYVYKSWGDFHVGTASDFFEACIDYDAEVYAVGDRITLEVSAIEKPYVAPAKKAKAKKTKSK
jgi:hypothetical protein